MHLLGSRHSHPSFHISFMRVFEVWRGSTGPRPLAGEDKNTRASRSLVEFYVYVKILDALIMKSGSKRTYEQLLANLSFHKS